MPSLLSFRRVLALRSELLSRRTSAWTACFPALRLRCFSVVFAAAVVGVACSSYGPPRLAPGASLDAARQALGRPTGDHALADGGRRLEFARGPMGRHTYMLDFNAHGQLVRWEQVLDEAHFADIREGMDAAEVLSRLGRASEQRYIGWQKQQVLAYRYETPFCQWFQVGLNLQGKVVDAAYGPDPLCDLNDIVDTHL